MNPARDFAGGGATGGHAARGRLFALLTLVAASAGVLCSAAPASAERPLQTGFADGLYTSGDPLTRATWFDATVDARAEIARINVLWRDVTSGEPTNPRNPADPAYSFGAIDGAVADATARGLTVLMTFYSAPNFAEGADPPGNVPAGTWKPKPAEVEDFAFALASRYPQVDYIQGWNEPTLDVYLTPQYNGNEAKSPEIYRDVLNATYKGVNDAGDAQVVTAGGAPYGAPPGGDRIRPIAFWRKVFCLKGRKALNPTNCPTEPKLDVFAHHPINTSGGPRRSAIHPDDASTPDLKNLVRVLRKAEQVGHADGGEHPVWATELWWESDPPDKFEGIPLQKHARWLEEALYLLWKQGAEAVINLQIRDADFDNDDPFGETVTGIFKFNEKKKPAFTAWRFPFVAHGSKGNSVQVWGKAPEAGPLLVERRAKGEWKDVTTIDVAQGDVFKESVRLNGKPDLRAQVADSKSLVWHLDKGCQCG